MPYIGIDFGTSNSVVANFKYGQAEVVPNQEGQPWTPSVVTLRRDGSLAFGQEAKENFEEQRSIRSIKRVLGTPERVPLVGQNLRTEQIAVMLFSLLKRDAERRSGNRLRKRSSPSRPIRKAWRGMQPRCAAGPTACKG